MPPKPATSAIQAPASEAMCRPSDGVVLEVVEVHQRGLAQVVVGELEVADLGGDDRLGAGRQRRVADRQRLVVGEVARFCSAVNASRAGTAPAPGRPA